MKLFIYVMKDSESTGYGPIKLYENKTQAIRQFCQLIVSQGLAPVKSQLLMKCLGTYDSETSEIILNKDNELIEGRFLDLEHYVLLGSKIGDNNEQIK